MNDLRIGNIKRKEKIKLSVNGTEIFAFKGETLLAALIAAGYTNTKTSPLKHEPRGALCGMGVCFECMVNVNGVPNIRSCMTEVENNMDVKTND
jgi:D-hydroxyproline dehydrogenase subunit gamma